jgi:hypothetical protein
MLRDVFNGHRTIKQWFAARRLRRRFRETSQHAIGAMPEDTFGRISAATRLLSGEPLIAPLSQRSCVYWSVEILEDRGIDWPTRTLVHEERHVPFVLEEDHHTAIVDPTHALVSLLFDFTSRSRAAFDANKEQKALLATHNLINRNWFATEELVYREAIIEVGERIWVLGSGTREPDPNPQTADGIYRTGPATRLRLTSSAQHPLCITDDPRCV